MNAYILLIVLNLGYGQKSITFQEFTSNELCKIAIDEIRKIEYVERLVCLKK